MALGWDSLSLDDLATPVSVAATALFLFAKLMQDKQAPNDLRTAKRVVESIEDNLTEEDSVARVTQLVPVHFGICQYVACKYCCLFANLYIQRIQPLFGLKCGNEMSAEWMPFSLCLAVCAHGSFE